MTRIIVDTSIVIDYLRQKDKSKTAFYQIFTIPSNKPVLPSTVISELWAGKSMDNERTKKFVGKLISTCETIFPNLSTAQKTGQILKNTNYEISFQDAQIGAFAIENKLPVLTINKKDFMKIKNIRFFE
jgi:predicted nucleic acid-binding protein